MTQAQPWYLYPISKSFNGGSEKGVDLKVPYGTNITPLFPGTVRSVATGPYGQEVDVAGTLGGQPVTASYVHLDQATVLPGQHVSQSSSLGWSGGQTVGGNHPASPAYSSYPHIELSLWPAGTTPYGGTPYNPMSLIGAVQSSGGGLLTTLGGGASSLGSDAGTLLASATPSDRGPIAGAFPGVTVNMPNYLNQVLSGLHVKGLPDLVTRGVLIGLGLVILVIVAFSLSGALTREGVTVALNSSEGQAVERAAGRAAKA